MCYKFKIEFFWWNVVIVIVVFMRKNSSKVFIEVIFRLKYWNEFESRYEDVL